MKEIDEKGNVIREYTVPWDRMSIGYCQKCGGGHALVDGLCWDCRIVIA